MVFLRYREGDIQWLQRVLLGEVENYASIPSNADIHIAEVARQRIVAVSALVEVGENDSYGVGCDSLFPR